MKDTQIQSERLVREILGDDYLDPKIEKSIYEEDVSEGRGKITVTLSTERTITGEGAGVVDAFFQGMIQQYSAEYPSLKNLCFVGFKVDAKIDDTDHAAHTDAVGEVTLLVENAKQVRFEFVASNRSMIAAALQATMQAVMYFVNSERAFFATRRALKDAESRGRADLVATFAGRLTDLVQNTSYTEAIEQKDGKKG